MPEKTIIMDKLSMSRAISRIAHEIIEKNEGIENVVLIGIQRRGVTLAKRIAEKIYEAESKNVQMGVLDITFYRDDLSLLSAHPVINGTSIDFSIDQKKVILIDDVIYTGRTIRAAIDALFDIGRPTDVQLAVMIDRGHRELPFKADYIGKFVPTSKAEIIKVNVEETDGVDKVTINEN